MKAFLAVVLLALAFTGSSQAVLRDVSVAAVVHGLPSDGFADAKTFSEFGDANPLAVRGPHLSNLFVFQQRVLWPLVSSALNPVSVVISGSSWQKVFWVEASGDVAGVSDYLLRFKVESKPEVRSEAMNANVVVSDPSEAVPASFPVENHSGPNPTSVRINSSFRKKPSAESFQGLVARPAVAMTREERQRLSFNLSSVVLVSRRKRSLLSASATTKPEPWPLHPGSHGIRTRDLQWMLGGHRPNVFTKVKPTFRWAPNGFYGARTKSAVKSYKYRLGWPQNGQCGATRNFVNDIAGPQLFAVLKGKEKRPVCWVSLVSSRLKAIEAATPTPLGLKWKALLVSMLGIHETYPNGGPCISTGCVWNGRSFPAIQASTGAYNAAWCVSTEQAVALLVGYGTFADRTAGVYYAADFYAARNLVFTKPKFAALVVFPTYDRFGNRVPGTGHMGFVTKVTASGFSYIAGNDGNAVSERYITLGSRPYLFIYLTRVTR